MQPERPDVDEKLIGSRIEQCWPYTEKNGRIVKVWCKGLVVAVLKGDKVHVEWDEDYLRPGDSKITKEKLLLTKWNKHTHQGWRMDLDYQ